MSKSYCVKIDGSSIQISSWASKQLEDSEFYASKFRTEALEDSKFSPEIELEPPLMRIKWFLFTSGG